MRKNLTLPDVLVKEVEAYAKSRDLCFGNIVTRALEDYIQNKKQK